MSFTSLLPLLRFGFSEIKKKEETFSNWLLRDRTSFVKIGKKNGI